MENPPCTASDRFTTGRWSDPSCRRKPTPRIIIPDTAKEKPIEGEVLAVGAGARDETGRVTLLDVNVLFGPWAGTDVLIDGQDRLILKESDILGVIEGKTRARTKAA